MSEAQPRQGEAVTFAHLDPQAARYLQQLCVDLPGRRVGSQGNRAATDMFAEQMVSLGLPTECPDFDCIDWGQEGATLAAGGAVFDVRVSPFSPGCHLRAPLAVASTLDELEAVSGQDKVLLVQGDLAREQLMPKNFPFYNPDEHKRIIELLEIQRPGAIVAATSRNPELAGAVYPFPLIEDGDFGIPSVYLTEEDGNRLLQHAGEEVALDIRAWRTPATGCNVIARQAAGAWRRIVLCAHIDSKEGTPGAIDNATGIVVLLLLAELLAGYEGRLGVELVALNGEDYYSSPGEVQYLESNGGRLGDVVLAVNLDGAGFHQGSTAYSLYDCPEDLARTIRQALSSQSGIVEGPQWYQSDHMLFVQNQVPAVAITSDRFAEIWAQIAHTASDVPGMVDRARLVNLALALRQLVLDLDRIVTTTSAEESA